VVFVSAGSMKAHLLLLHTGTEQLAQLRDVEVAVDSLPAAHLKVVHAQLALGNLETAFNGPARERYPQQPFARDGLPIDHRAGKKVFDLVGMKNIARDDQGVGPPRQAFRSLLAIEGIVLDFPNNGTYFAMFDAKLLPRLLAKDRGSTRYST